MELKDSGSRREFRTGAVRDIAEGKGRCDLLPLSVVIPMMDSPHQSSVLHYVNEYVKGGDVTNLYKSMFVFAEMRKWGLTDMLLEVSKQYEDGAKKYGEHNWEKGIPLHCYIDSAIRHFFKFVGEWADEPHDRAFIWNLFGAIWTVSNMPEMIDLEFDSDNQAE